MVAQRNGAKALLAGVAGAALLAKHNTFVPAPEASRVPVAVAAAGAAAALGAAPAFAVDEINYAAGKLTNAAYPFMKEVDWSTMLYLQKPGGSASALDWLKAVDKALVMGQAMDSTVLQQAALAHHKAIKSALTSDDLVLTRAEFKDINYGIGKLIASVPEEKTMDVYNAFTGLVGSDVPAYLMSTVNSEDAKAAYAGLMDFKNTVRQHPIKPTEPTLGSGLSETKLDAVGTAASKLSTLSYPFIKDIDWTSDIFLTPLPGVSTKAALSAVDKMIVMGAAMDPKLLKDAVGAHHKAIGSIDSNGVTSAEDYAAVNAALGKAIASVPRSVVMDVYNDFAKILEPSKGVIGAKMFEFSKGVDATAAYKAFLEFKDVVRTAM